MKRFLTTLLFAIAVLYHCAGQQLSVTQQNDSTFLISGKLIIPPTVIRDTVRDTVYIPVELPVDPPVTTLPVTTSIEAVQLTEDGEPDIHGIARVGTREIIDLSCACNWELIDSESQVKVLDGNGDIDFVVPDSLLLHRLDLKVKSANQEYFSASFVRNITVPIFKAGDPGVVVLDVKNSWQDKALGNKIILKGTSTAYLAFVNQRGTKDNPVFIQTQGQVKVGSLAFAAGNEYVYLDGCTDNKVRYGIEVRAPSNASSVQIRTHEYATSSKYPGIKVSHHITLSGIHVIGGMHGVNIEPGIDKNPIPGMTLFNILVSNSVLEGYYLGYWTENKGHAVLVDGRFYYLISEGSGNDGFQPGISQRMQVFHCKFINSGQKKDTQHMSTISLGEGCSGYFYNNTFENGHGTLNGATGTKGGDVHFFNNYFISNNTSNWHTDSWFRINTNPNSPITLAVYQNVWDTKQTPLDLIDPDVKGSKLNFGWDDNIVLGSPFKWDSKWNAYVIQTGYTKHPYARYDIDGYLIK